MTIPSLLLKKLYTLRSLKNTGEGAQFGIKNRLGDAMTAHATTNFLLGLWIVGTGQWHYW